MPCPKCGGTEFKYTEPLADDSFVECSHCGLALPLADIKQHGMALAKDQIAKEITSELRNSLGKLFK
jgi:hypothetical protein